MATKLFRCTNCEDPVSRRPGVEFEAAGPTCPTCGGGPRHVAELAVVHYDPPSGRVMEGLNHAACDPKVRLGRPGFVMTGLAAAVTCRACRATPVWAEQAAVQGVPEVQARG